MKKLLAVVLVFSVILLSGCRVVTGTGDGDIIPAKDYDIETEIRGIWLSYYEIPCAEGLTAEEYAAKANNLFARISELGLNTVFLHVRAFADAIYPSQIFPMSAQITGESGKVPDYDPLAVLLNAAQENALQVEAWINPFRICIDSPIPAGSPAAALLEQGNPESAVFVSDEGAYFNPASPTAQALIIDGVKEILQNYDVSGIHIDDYFYPSTEEKIDARQYQQYVSEGGTAPLAQWRRDTVSAFVATLYSTVKSFDSNKLFTVSPAGNLQNNYDTLYADVKLWLSEAGYADMIIPQLYFGMEHQTSPFEATAQEWLALPRSRDVTLLCGLAAYKFGKTDENAGTGSREWVTNTDIIKTQIKLVRSHGEWGGFSLFSYSSLLNEDGSYTPLGENVAKFFADTLYLTSV